LSSNWSPQQETAIARVADWLSTGNEQVFKLQGYAGTGKTTLAKALAQDRKNVIFAAYTGKAAHVLTTKGCPAQTIHSLIYKPSDPSGQVLKDLQVALTDICNELKMEGQSQEEIDNNREVLRIKEDIVKEKANLKKPRFMLNLDSNLRNASMLVVDECSMVSEDMAEDLLSFGVKILALGDPAQLPPVKGSGYFTEGKPDYLLTEIHRQAQDNPIIRLATIVRNNGKLPLGQHGESRVINLSECTSDLWNTHDQILVGREKRPANGDPIFRSNVNKRVRSVLGITSDIPTPGEKIVCLRNAKEDGLLNGSLWRTERVQDLGDSLGLTIYPEEEAKRDPSLQTVLMQDVLAHRKLFLGQEVEFWEANSARSFDFGYAMTVHKAQGSQWENVLLFDQSGIFRNDAHRWLYTGLTRASHRVTVVRC
jgi:exodeoxyribonuclease-5